MASPKNLILTKMLDRLFAGLASGPNLNCRPHSSRQRIDWTQLSRLKDLSPGEALCRLLSASQSVSLQAGAIAPKNTSKPGRGRHRPTVADDKSSIDDESIHDNSVLAEEKKSKEDWSAQQSLLTKLRVLAEDAREYEQDTGVHVLHVGFPLLSLPPGAGALKSVAGGAKRLLAPIAFIPVSLELRSGLKQTVIVDGLHDGADFLVPNEALFTWLERQIGQPILTDQASHTARDGSGAGATMDGFQDDEHSDLGTGPSASSDTELAETDHGAGLAVPPDRGPMLDPWEELNDLVRRVALALNLPYERLTPDSFSELRQAPRTDDVSSTAEIVSAAVLGLFPMNNQSLLRDTQALSSAPDQITGPLQSFISRNSLLLEDEDSVEITGVSSGPQDRAVTCREIPAERFVTTSDPCQAQAVQLARQCPALVIHGPPGTGKSQTITNIIGDHLAHGERVLLVCDKRTALDVVARRLEHLGLGRLCALIHDPQHDQRNLYMQVREQLEELSGASVHGRAQLRLPKLNSQLQQAYDKLASAWAMLMKPDPVRQISFHDRMGEWLAASRQVSEGSADRQTSLGLGIQTTDNGRSKKTGGKLAQEPATVELLDRHLADVRDIVKRSLRVQYATNPWSGCVQIRLTDFLGRSMSEWRSAVASLVSSAEKLDRAGTEQTPHFLDPESHDRSTPQEGLSFEHQQARREELAELLRSCRDGIDVEKRKSWVDAPQPVIERAYQRLMADASLRETLRLHPLDARLMMVQTSQKSSPSDTASQLGILESYLAHADKWYWWAAFRIRRHANQVVAKYGLPPGPASVRILRDFLLGVTARMLAAQTLEELNQCIRPKRPNQSNPPDPSLKVSEASSPIDDAILMEWESMESLLRLLRVNQDEPVHLNLRERLAKSLTVESDILFEELKSGSRAAALEEFRSKLIEYELFEKDWIHGILVKGCRGESIQDVFLQLDRSLEGLEEIIRLKAKLDEIPVGLRGVVLRSIESATEVETALSVIRRDVLSADIQAWLKSSPALQALDGNELTHLHHELIRLEEERQPIVRELIQDLWTSRQRERMLAGTGSRLNSLGADLRRRLTTRGERAMRLRQVISVGGKIEGGDPLFDLRPVWMASPETVAQIFPRTAMFDVVIFDEASQCRLEEALPVLTRAKRVVIAGDPKQLPPTRFFESAVISSDNFDVETEQELFESHQSHVEDLLSAALSLDIQESYLDVHYRSRNSDLVEFSNRQFYSARLQSIPGHPRNRVRFAPITLYHVNGIYEERINQAEAEQVVKIIADLLRRAEPPSIGVACFNLTQRDQILESLSELAAQDPDFSNRLAIARRRIGEGAFEGLFVKNLENVQGDERDHMIISTTYGPDSQGRFYRRFGPLGQAGGGRRLNVLITRARQEVHVVTSIPPELYRNLPPVPEGQMPGGGWLLFAYLSYAESLGDAYRQWREAAAGTDAEVSLQTVERPTRSPSEFSVQLARWLASRFRIGSDVHWGNDGFCVDVAFRHPRFPEDRTLGLLIDGTRFQNVDDPVGWDVFRTAILEGQGWNLKRCWTPHFFRDPDGFLNESIEEAGKIADTDPDPEAIPVE